MRLSILGTGRLGAALATRLTDAGHAVVLGSRTPDTASAPPVPVVSIPEAVSSAEVVVLAVPFAGLDGALTSAGSLDGTIVWSCTNALAKGASGLAVGFDDSAAETVARLAPAARVVEALPPFAGVLQGSVTFRAGRPTSFVCGDDQQAKDIVAQLLSDLGADAVDAGPLTAARYAEPAMMLLVGQAYRDDAPRHLALQLISQEEDS